MHTDVERCLRAVQSHGSRFDGRFGAAVVSTGIYCRPSCPVLPPKRDNVRFPAGAASAQQAGCRACKRCRPDVTPGSPEWDRRADPVARPMRLIGDGVVDRDGSYRRALRLPRGVRTAARRLGLPTSPVALARHSRAWRPWRAYATQHLRATGSHPINHLSPAVEVPA